ncbi:MAG TPA: nucleoside transporter C-terminal domain-containing protein [Anaerohalosphaeraceae bacterium]|nr:nucleoside transporter C-terminal domain-containing protein [Anaerohalosphaeraceae bacterium]
MSSDKRRLNWRLIGSGIALQLILAALLLETEGGQWFFEQARAVVTKIIQFSDTGAEFVFGANFKEHFFAFSVLPTIVFMSSMMSVLFYLGVIQKIIQAMAKVMVYVMDVSGSESLANAANIFFGMAEAPLVIRPYLDTMTRSELMAMMTGGMATISGATLAAYVGFGADAGHLLTASIISAPAGLVIAKIMVPETESSLTKGTVRIDVPRKDSNVLDAACRGAAEGLQLALTVLAVLICFTAFVSLLNWVMSLLPELGGRPLTLERLLGWICAPLAWVMGVEWKDAAAVGGLIGKKTILNEFIAYRDLGAMKDTLSRRSAVIATYALCGFANFGSVAIQIGGYSTLVPARRKDFASLGFKAMIGGSLAAFMTAAIAGMLTA